MENIKGESCCGIRNKKERGPSFKLRIVCVSVNVHLNSSHRQLLHKHRISREIITGRDT